MSCDDRESLSFEISMRTTDSKSVVIISFGTRKPPCVALSIFLFCFRGSRGDIQPFVVLAVHYKRHRPADTVTIITHPDLANHFRGTAYTASISFTAAGDSSFPANNTSVEIYPLSYRRESELAPLLDLCHGASADLIVFSTFCLEAWSVAEKLGVRAVGISLFLLDLWPVPPTFEGMIREEYPGLYSAMVTAREKGTRVSIGGTSGNGEPSKRRRLDDDEGHEPAPFEGSEPIPLLPPSVTYEHVRHWLWRMFLDDVGEYRENTLGLCPLPFLEELERQSREQRDTIRLPPPPRLLYALDAEVCEQEASAWPQDGSVLTCGFWTDDEMDQDLFERVEHARTERDLRLRLQSEGNKEPTVGRVPEPMPLSESEHAFLKLLDFICDNHSYPTATSSTALPPTQPIVYVGFGSMDQLHQTLRDPTSAHLLAHTLLTALSHHSVKTVWVTSGSDTTLHRELAAILASAKSAILPSGTVLLHPHPVPHASIFPLVARSGGLVVHHGGAGTFASCARAAVAQVVAPVQFDQPYWGERVVKMEVGRMVSLEKLEEDNGDDEERAARWVGLWGEAIGWCLRGLKGSGEGGRGDDGLEGRLRRWSEVVRKESVDKGVGFAVRALVCEFEGRD
ncbi:hypothetical protein BC937DRAFT_93829 [Endogone sp. FLAS-F59071]|nr:hypothetical protein BC937DRAFT_93829 [Endogone sp. FLAS-F59071]|eukprot:RUS21009.1 hypothetical protein BC937DRAFT_93829 [Endogone sp. FLAS-F59071]